jgi:hypothetical protein
VAISFNQAAAAVLAGLLLAQHRLPLAMVAQDSLAQAAAAVARACASQVVVRATTAAQASLVVMAAMQLVLQVQEAEGAAALSSEQPLAPCLAML